MPRLRHWKQRWDPDADLVFTKRLRLGLDPEKPFVTAGDPVPKDRFSIHRLKVWWRAGYVQLADWLAPDERRRLQRQGKKLPTALRPTGRGWYELTMPDGSIRKVRGFEAAKAEILAAELELRLSPERSAHLRAELGPPEVNLGLVNVQSEDDVLQAIDSGESDQAIIDVLARNVDRVRQITER